MMGVFIHGMEMPQNCAECWLYEVTKDMVSGEVLFLCKCRDVVVNNPYTTKDKGCPLVEIPTPHGRLGDLDELKTAFPRCDNSMDIKIASVRATINHAPTIIEAEGSEK